MAYTYSEIQTQMMLYNLFGYVSEEEIVAGKLKLCVTTSNNYGVLYMPALYHENALPTRVPDKGPFSKLLEGTISKCKIIFPANEGVNRLGELNVSTKYILPVEKNSVISGKMLYIDEFIPDVERIHKFVKNNGSLTLVMDNLDACSKFIHDGIKTIQSGFKYSSNINSITNGCHYADGCSDDILTLFINIHDLAYSMPIFNRKAIDGMAMSVILMWPKSSLHDKFPLTHTEFNVVVSNLEDNIFMIDGERVNPIRRVQDEIKSRILSALGEDSKRRSQLAEKTAKKSKEVKADPKLVPPKSIECTYTDLADPKKGRVWSRDAQKYVSVKTPCSEIDVPEPEPEFGMVSPNNEAWIEPVELGSPEPTKWGKLVQKVTASGIVIKNEELIDIGANDSIKYTLAPPIMYKYSSNSDNNVPVSEEPPEWMTNPFSEENSSDEE